ncbi:16S ribosomal RNA methyltransferase RsmE [Salinisphaera sp. T5B8]|uniref:16S rRNA (uracil(1498)-N(3))-methyltransferase n=1 Tax=Salinisphaera sp. T5B8 TaxID=1304154 RepID=UPI003341948B
MSRRGHVPRVFVDTPLAVGETLDPGDDKRHHLATVLRLGVDAPVTLFNGDGHEYDARIVKAERKRMTLAVEARHSPERESPLSITLYQAIARGDRMDFALAKAVELGVTAIRPVFTERGKVKLEGERLAKKQAHWQAVVESAAQQSGRLVCPPLEAATALSDCLDRDTDHLRLMLAPSATGGLNALTRTTHISLLVGPESGLSDTEIDNATAAGWQPITLGPRVLRTETAGMAALAALQSLWGDLAG